MRKDDIVGPETGLYTRIDKIKGSMFTGTKHGYSKLRKIYTILETYN